MIIHFHFHFKTTGVTRSVEGLLTPLNSMEETKVFGYGITRNKISFFKLLKVIYSSPKTIIHTHRNNETLIALILRFLGGKFKLVSTRHAESTPSKLTLFLMSKTDQCISLSQNMSNNLSLETTIIGHGIDTNHFLYDQQKRSLKPRTISVVGRIRKAKGQLDVIDAIAPLLNKNPNWNLHFIGTVDDPAYVKEINTISLTQGVQDQIHFVSQTNEIQEHYKSSSAVVIASHTEGFSLVCLEAMSSGCITIATEQVGIHSEVITHGINGFLYPKGDTHTLRKLLKEVIEEPEKLKPELVRKTILEQWSVSSSAKKLFDVYNKVRAI